LCKPHREKHRRAGLLANAGYVPAKPIVDRLLVLTRGTSQAAIARASGVSTAAISGLLAGKRRRVQARTAAAIVALGRGR
jgi:hypothetical protein